VYVYDSGRLVVHIDESLNDAWNAPLKEVEYNLELSMMDGSIALDQ
jgi:hypothetical protein